MWQILNLPHYKKADVLTIHISVQNFAGGKLFLFSDINQPPIK